MMDMFIAYLHKQVEPRKCYQDEVSGFLCKGVCLSKLLCVEVSVCVKAVACVCVKMCKDICV